MHSFTIQTAEQGTRLMKTFTEVRESLLGGDTDYQLSSISSYFPDDRYADCFKFRGNETESFLKFINDKGYIKVEKVRQLTEWTQVTEYYYLTPEVHNYIIELRASFDAFYEDLQEYIPSWIDENEFHKLTFTKVIRFASFRIEYRTEMPTKFHKRINNIKFDVIIPECKRIAEYQGLDIVHYSHHISEMDIYFKLK